MECAALRRPRLRVAKWHGYRGQVTGPVTTGRPWYLEQMGQAAWTPVPLSSLAEEPCALFLSALKGLVASPDGVMSSDSGRVAVSVSLAGLQDRADVEVHLDSSVRGEPWIVLLLSDEDTSTLAEELGALSTKADFVGIPSTLGKEAATDLLPCGQIIQHVDPALPETFEILERRSKITDLLTRDAPVGIEEGPDNLGGREAWFRKRHGGDT